LLVTEWHHTIALLSFIVEKLFILLVPEFVVVGVTFPNETDFVQKLLSIKSKFVLGVSLPLLANPLP
jgi:hypothetical protein